MVRGMLAEGGPGVLFRGLGAATLRLVPMAVVSFGTYELVRSGLLAWEDRQEAAAAATEYRALHACVTPLQLSVGDGGTETATCDRPAADVAPCVVACTAPCSPAAASTAGVPPCVVACTAPCLPAAASTVASGTAVAGCGALTVFTECGSEPSSCAMGAGGGTVTACVVVCPSSKQQMTNPCPMAPLPLAKCQE
jgi:solute carrier family 25 phosphate transporter 23/24/25/41